MNTPRLFSLALIVVAAFTAAADDALTAAAKKIFTEHQDSVIWVSAVAKVTVTAEGAKDLPFAPPDQENKVEALGTVVDASGLVVAALGQLDPSRNMGGREFRYGGSTIKIDATATIKDVKVTMADGTEIPAELVMKDADLDLAFIRVKTASKEAKGVAFKALDLKNGGRGGVLDEVITLGRVDEVLNRVATVTRGHITGATKKPREFLRVQGAAQGCPTFLPDGKVLGIASVRSVKNKGSQVVVIPAADVLEIAEQAKAAKPAAEKESPAKEEKAAAADK
ncbi:MAG: trypsin-like peptidase domain-containing protein [Verrucomicrobia bacterium]|nr:trypsin-like peptidase domain-containing protein [Verrucomicrobiota bacterium]